MPNFVITSTSASGKTTLINSLLRSFPSIYQLKTCTTRAVRSDEKGTEYHFLKNEEFINLITNNAFIEYSIVYKNYYGLLKQEIYDHANTNNIVILDVQGAIKFKSMFPNSVLIFIMPPPLDEIKHRLTERNTSEFDVSTRLNMVNNELNCVEDFTFKIPYDALEIMNNDLHELISFYLKYSI